jgi:hypothetical protein
VVVVSEGVVKEAEVPTWFEVSPTAFARYQRYVNGPVPEVVICSIVVVLGLMRRLCDWVRICTASHAIARR